MVGRLGDWEIGRLGDWLVGRENNWMKMLSFPKN